MVVTHAHLPPEPMVFYASEERITGMLLRRIKRNGFLHCLSPRNFLFVDNHATRHDIYDMCAEPKTEASWQGGKIRKQHWANRQIGGFVIRTVLFTIFGGAGTFERITAL